MAAIWVSEQLWQQCGCTALKQDFNFFPCSANVAWLFAFQCNPVHSSIPNSFKIFQLNYGHWSLDFALRPHAAKLCECKQIMPAESKPTFSQDPLFISAQRTSDTWNAHVAYAKITSHRCPSMWNCSIVTVNSTQKISCYKKNPHNSEFAASKHLHECGDL